MVRHFVISNLQQYKIRKIFFEIKIIEIVLFEF